MSPELAAMKFLRVYHLAPDMVQLCIANEWQNETLTHSLKVALATSIERDLPASFEGYPVRRVPWGQ